MILVLGNRLLDVREGETLRALNEFVQRNYWHTEDLARIRMRVTPVYGDMLAATLPQNCGSLLSM